MRIWLDDERPMPLGYDVHCKTAEDAKALIGFGKVTYVSFDHDLGDGQSGYELASWIEQEAAHGRLSRIWWDVHSANPSGAANIKRAMERADRWWEDGPIA